MEIKNRLLGLLNTVIGTTGSGGRDDELLYHCPFCKHHKKKLQINIKTQYWHCWVCDAKGRVVWSLFKKLNASKSAVSELNTIYQNTKYFKKEKNNFIVTLPEEFESLSEEKGGITYMHAIK